MVDLDATLGEKLVEVAIGQPVPQVGFIKAPSPARVRCVNATEPPLAVKAFEYRRVKNDERDAKDLADLLRMGRLPEAWIAPPVTREVRELVRHREKPVGIGSQCEAEVNAVLANCGVQVALTDMFGCPASSCWTGSWIGPNCPPRTPRGCPRCVG